MSSESIKNLCPPTCPTVKRQIRAAIAEAPWLLDGIFPRKKNDVNARIPSDIIPIVTQDELKPVIKADVQKVEVVDDYEKIETDVPSKLLEDIEARPVPKQIVVQEVKAVEKPIIVPTEEIIDHDDKKIDLAEEKELIQKITITQEPTVTPIEKIIDDKKIDFVEEKELVRKAAIIQKPTVIPVEEIVDRDDKKIYLVEERKLIEEETIAQKPTVTPIEKIIDRDDEKIDLVEEKELVQEAAIIRKPTVIPVEEIVDRDDKKIDLIEEKKIPVAIKELEVVEIDQIPTEIDLEPSVETKEYFELEKRVKPNEEEIFTDYEKFIDEEMEEALPVVIAKEIPEEPRKERREISENAALYEGIDRERAVRPPREREATTAIPEEREEITIISAPVNSVRAERRVAQDACDETCPLVREQKERITRKLKEQQRIIDHYYLTKGFSYFEDVCTCSLACMVYTLSRDPFVRSIFASLALFAVGLKLCSELDAWEMPSRVS